ncbi:MAG: DNA polymerase III subunit gamma/tau [Rhodospirillales bacterium]|nr:DNA polymerase III subunit gamma/tau [Rhodospirillales bacterium]
MAESQPVYRVLARKYRPTTFAELIGQEAMVRTLTNAIVSGRIAHAFILTGVRGVGKTTTARIIARALNCIGPDGSGGPTISPCGVCEPCRAIAEDRHVDVLEMDAASRTGVGEMRELLDGVRYKPVAARFKIYIIDEVHMLSTSAFNALLKTLEEPPPDVKFVFATTEIHKVPVTVLSRCQRFSLRRVPVDLLASHYAAIAAKEGVEAEPGAIGLIARAADGSVRDGLSLLDQAIALGDGRLTESGVRDMLGIADRALVFDLLESVLRGDAAGALQQMRALHDGGADPVMVLQDLLDRVHLVTRLKIVASAGEGDPLVEGERARAKPLADRLGMPFLTRAWQMLLKGIEEVQRAPQPLQAAEMVLIRLAYVADLPAPADVVRALGGSGDGAAAGARIASGNGAGGGGPVASAVARSAPIPSERGPGAVALAVETRELDPCPQSFEEVVALFERHRESLLRTHLFGSVHLVAFEPGRIELRLANAAPRELPNRVGQLLQQWTGLRWTIVLSNEAGAPTLREQAEGRAAEMRNAAAAHPLVRAVLDTFPGARIEEVREIAPMVAAPEEGEGVEG